MAAGTDLHGQFTAELLEVGAEPPQGAPIQPAYRRIPERRDNKIARVAAARKLLTLVFYGMRDGRIRCLQEAG